MCKQHTYLGSNNYLPNHFSPSWSSISPNYYRDVCIVLQILKKLMPCLVYIIITTNRWIVKVYLLQVLIKQLTVEYKIDDCHHLLIAQWAIKTLTNPSQLLPQSIVVNTIFFSFDEIICSIRSYCHKTDNILLRLQIVVRAGGNNDCLMANAITLILSFMYLPLGNQEKAQQLLLL